MSTFYANYPSAAAGSNPSTGANGLPAPTSSTEIGGINPSGNLQPLQTDASGNLLVDIASPIILTENIAQFGGNPVVTGTGASGLGIPRVTVSNDSTVGLNAGTNNIGSITNVTGTVSLPTGASTATLQTTGNTSLAAISTAQTNGTQTTQIVQGGNTAIVTATGAQKVDGSAVTQPISAVSLPLPTGAALDSHLTNVQSAVGTAATTAVTIQGSSTGSAVPISGSISISNFPSEQNVNVNQIGGSALAIGQQLSAASIPVVLPAAQITSLTPPTTVTVTQATGTNLHTVVDSSALPTGAATALNQTGGSQKTQVVDGSGNVINSLSDGNGGFAIEVAQAATSFQLSTGNSSVAQLAAGATFTGTIDAIINQQSYSILLTSDQPGTLTIKQFIDAAGAHLAQSIVYSISAGVGFSRSGIMNGNYAQLIFHNTGASTTTTFDLNTYYGTIPASTQLNNAPISINEVNGTALSLGQTTAANSIPVVLASGTPVPATTSGTLSANAPVYNAYSSTNITTTAYTQLIASTSNVINTLHIFDSSGQAMILATGASGSEVVQLYVPPGGDTFTLTIPAATRVAYKALTANATAGYLLISMLE